MNEAGPRVVDGRGLAPPQPMTLTLTALSELRDGEALVLLLHREPFPLYELLAAQGYSHSVDLDADGTFHVTITRGRSPQ
jgi:uncharacterized protein (DUF2249 family)